MADPTGIVRIVNPAGSFRLAARRGGGFAWLDGPRRLKSAAQGDGSKTV
ncbi:MAG: hypothetical protein PVI86_02285 [Phycisphaerae bacterium]